MIFNTVKLFAFVSAVGFALPAAAVNVCFFSNTQGCNGTSGCCNNLAVNQCCGPSTTATGFSVRWAGLPGSTTAQAWTSAGCTPASAGIRTFLNGPGDRCWTGGGVRAVSAAWSNGTGGRITSNTTGACSPPDVFNYPDADGVQHTVQITGDHTFDSLQALYDAGDLAALAALE